jgi:molybdopterin-guanine dinucleotide biosynthesis protein A
MQVGGIVLCGGKSSRMGMAKADLPFGPERMLQRVVRLLGRVVEPIVVVSAPDQLLPDLPPHIIVVSDRRAYRGPLEGLAAGLRTLSNQADAAYASGCDVPLLVPDFVQRLVTLLDNHDIVVPVDGEFYHPLAAVYRVSVLSEVEELLEADRLRPVFLYDRVSTYRAPVSVLKEFDPSLQTLANVNCPDDYLAAIREAGLSIPDEIARQLGLPPGSRTPPSTRS